MSDSTPTKSWNPGDVIAEKYVLQRPLAKGGMGSVWVAQNKMTERRVAIKFVLPELAGSPDTIQRFFREAKASARIDHPSIVDVLDLGTLDDDVPFMVMEYLEGRSLELLIDYAPLTPVQAAAILLDVTRALAAAHAAGIVHRDLKPANIFIAKKGDALIPKILDFGISKITSSTNDIRMTRTGAVLGSPAYMSPEQARGRSDIDGRADIWAIGVILYEAVSGKLPFSGENYNQVMMSITLDEPKPLKQVAPAVDDDFAAIVDACLQKERDQRPPSMEALATLLDGYVAPRAAYGIPPVDIGEQASDAKKISPPSRRMGYAIPRASPSPRPAAGTRTSEPNAATVRRDDPQLATMGAVTVVDPPMRRGRGVMYGAIAVGLVGALAAGGWFVMKQKDSHAPAASAPPAPVTAPSASATAAPPVTASATQEPAASVSAAPSVEPSAVPSVSASASQKPKPPKWAPPKPKGSDGDGPANVGPGPGF